ncbi:MAG: efflux transporter periplasmic adaptor subunit [Hyphomicrobiales bacterium]|nr:efflux transporter periplasmic adaptor subunit [Hyphomicrobiales bacterium]
MAAFLAMGSAALAASPGADASQARPSAPAVTVAVAKTRSLAETVTINGTLVAREEILIGPEIEGLRIVEILAEEGDKVAAGQALARLSRDVLDAQLAQSDAALTRADAQIAQVKSQIRQAEATIGQTGPELQRAQSLLKNGVSTQAQIDQKLAADRTAQAQLESSRQALNVSEADKASLLAQRRELQVRIARSEVRAPVAGVVSRRTARLGAIASAAGDAMFRLISAGEVELEGEAFESRLSRLAVGQAAEVSVGEARIAGKVRLVSPEIDRTTRLGRVRILLEPSSAARIGGYARGVVVTRRADGVSIPSGSILYDGAQPLVQVVKGDRVETRKVKVGIAADGFSEILSGVAEGEPVVARAGSFLRDGDAVRPISIAEAR